MRTTVVPAQITTVEDRIAGNLTFVQVLLLVAALLLGSALYITLPPHLHLGSIKLTLICLQFVVFGGLALRIHGKIVADWLILYLRFMIRPRIYVFTKNDVTGRDILIVQPKKITKSVQSMSKPVVSIPALSLSKKDHVGQLLDNPALTVRLALV